MRSCLLLGSKELNKETVQLPYLEDTPEVCAGDREVVAEVLDRCSKPLLTFLQASACCFVLHSYSRGTVLDPKRAKCRLEASADVIF